MTEPAQPALGFIDAITTRFILDCTSAPAHIWHGSSVTYNVQSSNLQSPVFLLAFLIAVISACASVFLSVFLLLYPRAIILSSCTITHPIGTSSSAYAFFACFMASFIYLVSNSFIIELLYKFSAALSSTRRRRRQYNGTAPAHTADRQKLRQPPPCF